ncbi:hypothetical protein FK531_02200 [Rhodococcus spelaei]|uniref:Uncharacterized protein n=1 Tax=Rhodococcus spelaei TaxID=2546320 RepID=A0A541BRH0_9NOCA|nr:hypothetical protein [Rhodococcus spelaei]TQF74899.1 hypothetical protein FK531_02200 [Rhodococcus spelaei]
MFTTKKIGFSAGLLAAGVATTSAALIAAPIANANVMIPGEISGGNGCATKFDTTPGGKITITNPGPVDPATLNGITVTPPFPPGSAPSLPMATGGVITVNTGTPNFSVGVASIGGTYDITNGGIHTTCTIVPSLVIEQ